MTQVVNDLVNGAGWTSCPGSPARPEPAPPSWRGRTSSRAIFGSLPLRQELSSWDNQASLPARRPGCAWRCARSSSGLALAGQQPASALDSQGTVDQFTIPARDGRSPELMVGADWRPTSPDATAWWRRVSRRPRVPRRGAAAAACCLLNIVEIALREDLRARGRRACTSRSASGSLPALVQRILALPREDRWQTMAVICAATTCTTSRPSSPRRCSRPRRPTTRPRRIAAETDERRRHPRAADTRPRDLRRRYADLARLRSAWGGARACSRTADAVRRRRM